MPGFPGVGTIGWPGGGGVPGTGGGGSSNPFGGLLDIFKNPSNIALIASSVLGSLFNRPKGLSKEQKAAQDAQLRALQQLIGTLSQRANAPLTIDPRERALLYGNIAENQAGAITRGTHSLAGRGLSQSGILGDYLNRVNLEGQRGQNAADLGLLQQAGARRQADTNALLGALGIQQQPVQGQSVLGGITGGLAPILAYLLRTQQLEKNAQGSGSSTNNNLLAYLSSLGQFPLP